MILVYFLRITSHLSRSTDVLKSLKVWRPSVDYYWITERSGFPWILKLNKHARVTGAVVPVVLHSVDCSTLYTIGQCEYTCNANTETHLYNRIAIITVNFNLGISFLFFSGRLKVQKHVGWNIESKKRSSIISKIITWFTENLHHNFTVYTCSQMSRWHFQSCIQSFPCLVTGLQFFKDTKTYNCPPF